MIVALRLVVFMALLSNIWTAYRVSAAMGQCVDGLSGGDSFSLEGADHLPYNASTGYQVILPGLKFNCYGNITSWNALVVAQNFTLSYSTFGVVFQVWRPTGRGRYSRIGYDLLNFHASYFGFITTSYPHPHDGSLVYANLTGQMEVRNEDDQDSEDNRPLTFQPGDIVGFYIRSHGSSKPLYPTYRNATEEDDEDLVMDMYYMHSQNHQLCQMSECSEKTSVIASVIPNIYFTFDTLDGGIPEQEPLSTDDCTVMDVEECRSPSSTTPPPAILPSSLSPSSLTPSHPTYLTTSPTVVSFATPPTVTVAEQSEVKGMLLAIIVVSVVGAVVMIALGGLLVTVIAALICKIKH